MLIRPQTCPSGKYLSGGSRRYLFDLEADPSEQENLIASHPQIASHLEAQREKWIARLDSPGQTQKLGREGSAHFDHYLDKKAATQPAIEKEPVDTQKSK